MNRFIRHARDLLNFSKSDRNGVITLTALIIIATAGHFIINFINLRKPADHAEFEKAMAAWYSRTDSSMTEKIDLFRFDPNTVSRTGLDSLPLPERVKNNLLRYRDAGGRFLKPGDLKKIYGMNDSIYEELKDYISIESCPDSISGVIDNPEPEREVTYRSRSAVSHDAGTFIELNSADSLQLVRLRGIGPVFAARIIKYRNLLGGFYCKRQLLEVYNFPEETFNEIKRYINIDSAAVKKIRINYAGFGELIRHPYLEKSDVNKIMEFRERYGRFSSMDQIISLELADSLKKEKMRHYFTCR
jgi:DNA uptake protein ComE-like DNA-binding protein